MRTRQIETRVDESLSSKFGQFISIVMLMIAVTTMSNEDAFGGNPQTAKVKQANKTFNKNYQNVVATRSNPAVKINENLNQTRVFKKAAPVNTAKRLVNAKTVGKSTLKHGDLVMNAGNAALKNRKALKAARQTAKLGKYATRAALASTGVGLIAVAGSIAAEALIGDSAEDIAIDSVDSLAQGKSLEKVAQNIGKRLDPKTIAANSKKNLDQTGRDISKAIGGIGNELKKIKFPF